MTMRNSGVALIMLSMLIGALRATSIAAQSPKFGVGRPPTPEELRDLLESGEDLLIVDLRTKLDDHPGTIPGAVRISTEDLTSGVQAIPRDRDIILFCS